MKLSGYVRIGIYVFAAGMAVAIFALGWRTRHDPFPAKTELKK